jgi:VRR-NUC domain
MSSRRREDEYPHISEAHFQRETLKYLNAQPDLLAWRVNSGKVQTLGGVWFQGAPIGTPDVCGYVHGGRAFYIELKIPKGRVSPEQLEWHAAARHRGVAVFLCRNFTQVRDTVRVLREGFAPPMSLAVLEANHAMLQWNEQPHSDAPVCIDTARELLRADALERKAKREASRLQCLAMLPALLGKPGEK